METPSKFISITSTDDDPSLRIKSFAIKNLLGVFTSQTSACCIRYGIVQRTDLLLVKIISTRLQDTYHK